MQTGHFGKNFLPPLLVLVDPLMQGAVKGEQSFFHRLIQTFGLRLDVVQLLFQLFQLLVVRRAGLFQIFLEILQHTLHPLRGENLLRNRLEDEGVQLFHRHVAVGAAAATSQLVDPAGALVVAISGKLGNVLAGGSEMLLNAIAKGPGFISQVGIEVLGNGGLMLKEGTVLHCGKATVGPDHHVHNNQMGMQMDVIGPADTMHEHGRDHLARYPLRNAVMGLPARDQMVVDELGCFGDGTLKRFTHRKIEHPRH